MAASRKRPVNDSSMGFECMSAASWLAEPTRDLQEPPIDEERKKSDVVQAGGGRLSKVSTLLENRFHKTKYSHFILLFMIMNSALRVIVEALNELKLED